MNSINSIIIGFTFVIVFLFFAKDSKGQTDQFYEFPSKGWTQSIIHTDIPVFEPSWTLYFCSGDTLIEGEEFLVMESSDGQFKNLFFKYDIGKVYRGNSLLFDFTLKPGDTITIQDIFLNRTIYRVTDKNKFQSNRGDSLYSIRLVDYFDPESDTIEWKEGIGDARRGLYPFPSYFETIHDVNFTFDLRGYIDTFGSAWSNLLFGFIHGEDRDGDFVHNYYGIKREFEIPCDQHNIIYSRECDTIILKSNCGKVILAENYDSAAIVPDVVDDNFDYYFDLERYEHIYIYIDSIDWFERIGYIKNLSCFEFDCNDNNASVNMFAIDIPENGIDENCDEEDSTSRIVHPTNSNFYLYPNPASNQITIDSDESQGWQSWSILSIDGVEIYKGKPNGSKEVTISGLDSLPPGIYVIILIDENHKVSRRKFIVD